MTDNPSPEMIERVAKAICAATNGPLEGGSWALMGDKSRQRIRNEARAAIAAMQAQQPNPSPIELARHKVAREVEGDSDNPLRVAEANAIYNGQRDNKYPEILAALNPSPADELTTLQARLDAIRAELETGIANLHETLEGEEDRFWSRYWQGYLKAYESLLEKFGAISGDKA